MAAASPMTDYERRRQENIRRNSDVIAALNLRAAAAGLSSALRKRRSSQTSTKTPKKPRPHSLSTPIVLRRSLRTRGLPPTQNPQSTPPSPPKSPSSPSAAPRKRGPLRTDEAFIDSSGPADKDLMAAILSGARIPRSDGGCSGAWDPRRGMELREENVIKLVPERILSVRFLPLRDRSVVAVGDKAGHVGFWDLGFEGESDGKYLYAPHSGPVSAIFVHPFSATKIFTSSYDGFIRLMDVEEETFNMIYSTEYPISSICQQPNDNSCLYIGEGSGELKIWDEREGKVACSWELHEQRINSIDFSQENTSLMATSSTDGQAFIWDIRSMKKGQPDSLKVVKHRRSVQSAYFSPSGNCLATTSLDDSVRILSGVNFDDQIMIKHNNLTGRWLSTFRAIWGWDDSYLYMGNMGRAVDVISPVEKSTTSLESELMTSIPCRFAAHPYVKGSLACANAGGKVFLWTKLENL